MYLFCMPEMLYNHVRKEFQPLLVGDRKVVFENLLTGINLQDTTDIDRVAEAVTRIPENRLRKITQKQVVAEFLDGRDYIDWSGNLI